MPDATKAALDYARICGKLKTTKRTGWVKRSVPNVESVADHSWRVAALCYLLDDCSISITDNNNVNDISNTTEATRIDISKCVQLAVVHDLAEAIVGDIAPGDGVSKAKKHQLEHQAMDRIVSVLKDAIYNNSSDESLSTTLGQLFDEYEKRETIESIVVKDLDLLDMIIQADEYECECASSSDTRDSAFLQEFFDGTGVDRFKHPKIKKIAKELHSQRKDRLASFSVSQSKQVPSVAIKTKEYDHLLSQDDQDFVKNYAKSSSHLQPETIADIVRALRVRDNLLN